MKAGIRTKILVVAVCSLAVAQGSVKAPAASQDRIIDFFEVHDAEIKSVFKQLSAYSGVDIVVSENVKGVVSLTVTSKSWGEILGIICKVHNLAATNEGSYVYVMNNSDYMKRQIENATGIQATQDVSPLRRELIRINHVPAKEVMESVESLLSPRGKITLIAHNNSVIIYDSHEHISQIKKMIAELDIEVAQVQISCKIIEVSSGAIQRMGIHFGYRTGSFEASHLPQTGIVSGAIERLSYGIISPEKFTAALEYLFTDNKGEIIAQPQITTIDNKEARIFMGQQVPVKVRDEAGNTVVQMINAGTALVVRPHISGEGRILLELSPKKESYTMVEGQPVINEQSATTNVVVSNGETVVIAGLTSNETRKVDEGIPFLKDIPLLGNLFKRSEKNVEKKDLIIFVTPHVIQSGTVNAPEQLPAAIEEISGSNP
ncbi:MAG: hypothetical protein GX089_15995 [Fibrobacter sp.]|jgi:type IV pilus assembly protein PilQ|nr:hypothetical protein [Fibrobacter sp.]